MPTSSNRNKVVTPFQWQEWSAQQQQAGSEPKRSAKAGQAQQRRLSAQEKADRVLANHWGGAYCRPGRIAG